MSVKCVCCGFVNVGVRDVEKAEAELAALREVAEAAQKVADEAGDMIADHCDDDAGRVMCEQYGCGTLKALIEPLRAALARLDEVRR